MNDKERLLQAAFDMALQTKVVKEKKEIYLLLFLSMKLKKVLKD